MIREAILTDKSVVLHKIGRLETVWRDAQNYTHPKTGDKRRRPARRLLRISETELMKRDLLCG